MSEYGGDRRLQKQCFIDARMRAATTTAINREDQFTEQELLAYASDKQLQELAELQIRAAAVSGLIDELMIGIMARKAMQGAYREKEDAE